MVSAMPQHSSAGPSTSASLGSGARTIELDLVPGVSLGPFKLGCSLWRTIRFLRSNNDAYPHVQMTWQDAAQQQQQSQLSNGNGNGNNEASSSPSSAAASSAAGAQPPILVSPSAHIHLAFDARYQRLQSITFETLSNDPASSQHKLAAQEEAWYRPTRIHYRGQAIYSSPAENRADASGGSGTTAQPQPRLTRSTIHQLLGPTYPGQERVRSDGVQRAVSARTIAIANASTNASGSSSSPAASSSAEPREFVLSYPGVAFSFPISHPRPSDPNQAQERNVQASTVYVFQGKQPHSSSSGLLAAPIPPAAAAAAAAASDARSKTLLNAGHGTVNMNCEALLDEDTWVEDAVIFPGEGVRLLLSHAPTFSSSSSSSSSTGDSNLGQGTAMMAAQQRQEIDLQVGQTTVQDVLCELGAPEGRFLKEEDRMQIHHRAGGNRGSAAFAGKEDSEGGGRLASDQTIQGQPFFFNYFSLGLDLYFDPSSSPTHDEPVLRKIILHSNTPGHALFQRYQRIPWRFAQPARDGRHLPRTTAGDAPATDPAQQAERSSAFDYMRSFDDLSTFLTSNSAAVKSASKAATGKSSAESATDSGRETMLLDRSFDPSEFKGLLELDVRSTLHGFPGCVLEVTDRDGRVACITVLN